MFWCVLGQAPIIPRGVFWDRFIINIPLVLSLIGDVAILTQNQWEFYSVWQAFPLFLVFFHVTINYDNNSFCEV